MNKRMYFYLSVAVIATLFSIADKYGLEKDFDMAITKTVFNKDLRFDGYTLLAEFHSCDKHKVKLNPIKLNLGNKEALLSNAIRACSYLIK